MLGYVFRLIVVLGCCACVGTSILAQSQPHSNGKLASSGEFLKLKPGHKFVNYDLKGEFDDPKPYLRYRRGFTLLRLYYAEAKQAPINVYFEKSRKQVFLIEIDGSETRFRYEVRRFLSENETDLGSMYRFLGYRSDFLKQSLKVDFSTRISSSGKKYLECQMDFGIISFQTSLDQQDKEWISGIQGEV